MTVDESSFQLCPPVTQLGVKISSGASESGHQIEIDMRPLPPDWPLKQAEARRLWARFLVRGTQSGALRERLKETA